jgi:site-specific DNA-methyltransferase (adenine-specific)
VIEMRRGDALLLLDALEDESIDAVITDPPYSSGGAYRSDRVRSTGAKYVQTGQIEQRPDFDGDSRDQRSYLAWCSLWMCRCLRALKSGRPILVFCDWRQLPVTSDAVQAAGFIWRGVIVWDKTEAARPILGFSAQAEYIVWGTRGPIDLGHDVYLPGLVRAPVRDGDRWHQTGKPLGLMEQLVEVVPPDGLILDPFAGSASTLVAARNRGRRGLGFEINVDYLETSGRRLDQLSLGGDAAA